MREKTMTDLIVGIDLGTTNSEIAAFVNGKVEVLGPEAAKMLPSCVGFSPAGTLLVGREARHQQLLYPNLTIRSIKRKMGSTEPVKLGDKQFTPQEISSLILRQRVQWAEQAFHQPIRRAVITVPAYFSDAQRNATREAGELAGLEVVRILNEPTAASLAYGFGDAAHHTAMVYDLGGGTFDVSIVSVEGDVTEVLASHGNNQLGGDDFDNLLLERLEREFQNKHGINLQDGHPVALVRLWWAAEEAKKKLSFEPYVRVREEALVSQNGKPLHLDVELSREEYEEMIRPLIESTFDSVSKALQDARKGPSDIDAILLVGGSTRTPLISRRLRELTTLEPRQDIHPDLCVALGSGVLASRLAGHGVERVLVDVCPFSFGPSYLGERGGLPYPHCYHPIIYRNTPLPVTRTESYATAHPYQTSVRIEIYQGEEDDALKNILVGDFRVEGLRPMEEPNEVLCRMSLDIDGILRVTAIEKETGKSKQITIARALREKSPAEIAAARERMKALYASHSATGLHFNEGELASDDADEARERVATAHPDAGAADLPQALEIVKEASDLVEQSQRLLGTLHEEDRQEAIDLHEKINAAIRSNDAGALKKATGDLRELLFFVEGH
ncbi:MAG: heat-shock protein Hsp70 [Acidobacteria bacterium]|nr:MAG: heat-shock protein Hsp70 [Acidobacteriota bacterium]